MPTLPQLLNAERYSPCDWDLKADDAGRRYWANLFLENIPTLISAIRQADPAIDSDRLEDFRARYHEAIRDISEHPQQYNEINILTFVRARQRLQHEFGYFDPYLPRKNRENEIALALLPEILRELDQVEPHERPALLARNLLAGNLFDMGAPVAIAHYANHGADFKRLRDSLPPRPWLADDLDTWDEHWRHTVSRHVAFFVDNAGSDILLGCIPLARWMVEQGAHVTLLANDEPTLNDVTAPECEDLVLKAAKVDSRIATAWHLGKLSVTGSGNWAPLIDLRKLSDTCVKAIADADMIILQGMGRAVETNYLAEFSCPVLNVAVLKDEGLARRLGGKVFDCVFRFRS